MTAWCAQQWTVGQWTTCPDLPLHDFDIDLDFVISSQHLAMLDFSRKLGVSTVRPCSMCVPCAYRAAAPSGCHQSLHPCMLGTGSR